MASKAVVEAVTARLGSTWNGLAVVTANAQVTDTPEDGSPFLVLQFPVSSATRPPVSTRYYREEGGFRIVINAARGSGTDQLLTWCDELADLFRDEEFDGVETQVPSPPFFDDNNEDGNYYSAAIAFPYTYNFTG